MAIASAIRTADPDQHSDQVPSISRGPAPSVITPRIALDKKVSGKYSATDRSQAGMFEAEKKTLPKKSIGKTTMFARTGTVSMFFDKSRHRKTEPQEHQRPQDDAHGQKPVGAGNRDVKVGDAQDDEQKGLRHGHAEPGDDVGRDELVRTHRRGQEPLQDPLLLVAGEDERHRENRHLHDRHGNHARQEKVDVAEIAGVDRLLLDREERGGVHGGKQRAVGKLVEDRRSPFAPPSAVRR